MWSNHHYGHYLSKLQDYIQQQTQRIDQLEETIVELKDQLSSMQNNNGNGIEKIEYHFDQLKIETLEGTLNIGLTPNTPGEIEDFINSEEALESSPQVMKTHPNLLPKIKHQMEHFLRKDCNNLIQSKANELQYPIDVTMYPFILQDIQNQLDNRIMSYLNQVTPHQVQKDGEEKVVQHICSTIQTDIENGIHTFMQNMLQKGM
ncbi:spore germination protein GerPC [Bacillus solimangrovi]|uniref:Uncharacterized protein n=1 Tax=Bacillus solimangrovi TaxID=1305675 RepID=A0A1E5LC56_9BACI|nr:spore germination protein GerPC [Bacillus solimangrovi]OEH91670.1 hypothetical protein BFG57_04680 [Bacillus solimangrovi]